MLTMIETFCQLDAFLKLLHTAYWRNYGDTVWATSHDKKEREPLTLVRKRLSIGFYMVEMNGIEPSTS